MVYKKISIVIPIYNEKNTIAEVLRQVQQADVLGLEKEIILVDDFSTDGTRQFVDDLDDPIFKKSFHERNFGKGAALLTGFRQSTGDIVVVQDADLEYDPSELKNIIAPFMNEKVSVVYGSRYLRPSPGLGFWHSKFNQLFTLVASVLLRARITDIMTCYKAFSREALNSFVKDLESQRFGFEPEVTARLAKKGFQIYEVP